MSLRSPLHQMTSIWIACSSWTCAGICRFPCFLLCLCSCECGVAWRFLGRKIYSCSIGLWLRKTHTSEGGLCDESKVIEEHWNMKCSKTLCRVWWWHKGTRQGKSSFGFNYFCCSSSSFVKANQNRIFNPKLTSWNNIEEILQSKAIMWHRYIKNVCILICEGYDGWEDA